MITCFQLKQRGEAGGGAAVQWKMVWVLVFDINLLVFYPLPESWHSLFPKEMNQMTHAEGMR